MVPLFGNFNLWLALFLAIFQLVNSLKKNNNSVIQFNKIAASSLFFCSFLSFVSLTYSHIVSDFSLINVFQNSHTTKPMFYKISGVD